MITMAQLWLPWLLSAVGVFVASSLIHMVFKWHNSDYRGLVNEDEVAAAIRRGAAQPGLYTMPHCTDMKQMQTPEMQKKLIDGPNALIAVRAPGLPNMGKHLGLWFLLALLVSGFAACICATVFGPGAAHDSVMHVAGLLTFAAYATGSVSDAIWYGRPWSATAKDLLDALIYALVTGALYAALWPA